MEEKRSTITKQQGSKSQKVEVVSMTVKVIGYAMFFMFLLACWNLFAIVAIFFIGIPGGIEGLLVPFYRGLGWETFVFFGIPFIYNIGILVASLGIIVSMRRWALYLFTVLTILAIANFFVFHLQDFVGYTGIQVLVAVYSWVISKKFT